MDFSQAGHRVIEGLLKENILLLQPPNIGKTIVLPVLPMVAPPGGSIAVVDEMGDNVLDVL